MQKITPFLWFDDNAEQAMNHYTSIFKNSRIISVDHGPTGSVMSVSFELEGQPFIALNGGPHFKLTEAFSLLVDCESQEEVDELWDKLLAGGGQPSQCGWLKDRFGLTWQIVPSLLMRMIQGEDREKSQRVMQAMLQMVKIDIAGLKRAYEG